MAFCTECGARLSDGAKFCANCGTAVAVTHVSDNRTIRASEEKILKCPSCHSPISRVDAICPFCGAPISDREASASVQRFAQQLYEIEREDAEQKASFDPFGLKRLMEHGYGSKSFNRKISLISSFPIPNTIEEITEFVILSANSIDVRRGKNSFENKMYGNPGSTYYSEIKLANTWINKLNQAYDKAKISFRSDPMFPKIEKIYTEKMKELNRKVSD